MSNLNTQESIIFTYAKPLRQVFKQLARGYREKYGIKCILLTLDSLENIDCNGYDEIISFKDLIQPLTVKAEDHILNVKKINEIEWSLNVRLLESIRADRHFGHEFVTGANFPQSYYSQMNFESKLAILLAFAERIQGLLKTNRVICSLTMFGDILTYMLGSLSEAHEIPSRMLMWTRSGTRMNWAVDRYNTPWKVRESYQKILESINLENITVHETDRLSMDQPIWAKVDKTAWKKKLSVKQLVSGLVKQIKHKGLIKKELKKRYGSYYFKQSFCYTYLNWREKRKQLKILDISHGLSREKPFVFFPLSVEPESTIMSWSQHCNYQLGCIDILSKTIPTGWSLVVKEHPFFSKRPIGFWEMIKRYPNVIIAGAYDDGEVIGAKARITAVINSTMGIQAAVDGKAVLTFHKHFVANVVNHVEYANSYDEVEDAMTRLAQFDDDGLKERLRQGEALKLALEANSISIVECPTILNWKHEGKDIPADIIEGLSDLFFQSIGYSNETLTENNSSLQQVVT